MMAFHSQGLVPGGEKKRRVSMDAGYSVLNSDLDACRMFDQYAYKVSVVQTILQRAIADFLFFNGF